MNPEDRLRDALSGPVHGPPPQSAWDGIQARIARRHRWRRLLVRRWAVAVVAVAALAGSGVAIGESLAPAGDGNRVQVVTPTTLKPTATTPPTTGLRKIQTVPPAPPATPTTLGPVTVPTVPRFPLSSVDWPVVVDRQLDCGTYPTGGTVPVHVDQVSYVEQAGGYPEALVLARCNPGAGDAPDGLYLYWDSLSRTNVSLAEVLLAAGRGTQETAFTVSGPTITMNVSAFSDEAVPLCCPDLHYTLKWTWAQSSGPGGYVGAPAGAVGPVPLNAHVAITPAGHGTSTYDITVTNTGPEPVTSAQLYALPPNAQGTPSRCTSLAPCSLGTIASGGSAHLLLTGPVGCSVSVDAVLPSGTIFASWGPASS